MAELHKELPLPRIPSARELHNTATKEQLRAAHVKKMQDKDDQRERLWRFRHAKTRGNGKVKPLG